MDAVECFKDVLPFYGVELQSHAAIILGLALLAFAIAQVWGQILTAGKLTSYDAPLFSILVALMAAGIVYQLLRLYTYGKLASALLNVSALTLGRSRNDWNKEHPEEPWSSMLNYRKVSMYSAWVFGQYSRPWLKLKVFSKVGQGMRPSILFLSLSFETAFALSYGLIFGSIDWSLPKYLFSFGLVVMFGYFVVWRCIGKPWVMKELLLET